MGFLRVIGNILWFLFTGLWLGLMWGILGIIWCITIIGIPFGKQCFKLSRLAFWPFGAVIISAKENKANKEMRAAQAQ